MIPIPAENPITIHGVDERSALNEIVENIVKGERKKLLKAYGKRDSREDDLMNFSHMGMSLLTISDHNTSRDVNNTGIDLMETPRLLDDNLLDMDRKYKDDRESKPPKLPVKFETIDFAKNKRKIDHINLTGSQNPSQRGTQHWLLPGIGGGEVLVENDYMTHKNHPTAAAMNTKDPKGLSKHESHGNKTFADFFTIKAKNSHTEDQIKKTTDLLRRTIDSSSQGLRGASAHSDTGSAENRARADTQIVTPGGLFVIKDEKLKQTRFNLGMPDNIAVSTISTTTDAVVSRGTAKSDLRSIITKRPQRSMSGAESPEGRVSRLSSKFGSGISPAPAGSQERSSESLLTAKARELVKTKKSHRTIPSKFHAELFKMMDAKSRNYDFSDSQMGDQGVHFISKYLRENMEVDTLKLDNCKITDDGLSILLQTMLDISVDKIYLRDNGITKEGLDRIMQFAKRKAGLHLVNLKGNPIDKSSTTASIKDFSALRVILLV